MRKTLAISLALFGLLPRAGFADDGPLAPVALPGSLWIAATTLGPSEPGNEVGQSGFEQGIVVWREGNWFLFPYVGLSLSGDTAGHAWNNKHPATVGVKLARRVPGGAVHVAGGLMFERDPATGTTRHPMLSAQYWAGWAGDSARHEGRGALAFPGHGTVSSGLVTGRDPNNWITSLGVQQGVRVYGWKGVAAVPFAEVGGSVDTKRRPWENRLRYEAGVKAVKPLVGGVMEAGVAQRREHRFVSRTNAAGPVVFVNFWIGWNPRSF